MKHKHPRKYGPKLKAGITALLGTTLLLGSIGALAPANAAEPVFVDQVSWEAMNVKMTVESDTATVQQGVPSIITYRVTQENISPWGGNDDVAADWELPDGTDFHAIDQAMLMSNVRGDITVTGDPAKDEPVTNVYRPRELKSGEWATDSVTGSYIFDDNGEPVIVPDYWGPGEVVGPDGMYDAETLVYDYQVAYDGVGEVPLVTNICLRNTPPVDPEPDAARFMPGDGEPTGNEYSKCATYTIPVIPVTPVDTVEPSLKPAEKCGVEATVILPETEGITYTQTRDGQTVTVSAAASPGYVLAEGATAAWTFEIPAVEACEEPTVPPVTPTVPPTTEPTVPPTTTPATPEPTVPPTTPEQPTAPVVPEVPAGNIVTTSQNSPNTGLLIGGGALALTGMVLAGAMIIRRRNILSEDSAEVQL